MSANPGVNEDELVDDLCECIPDTFFNYDLPNDRFRNTVAVLDYIYALKTGSTTYPELSHPVRRRVTLKDLKDIVPEKHFVIESVCNGKRSIDPDKNRIVVLLAAQRYLEDLLPPEEESDLSESTEYIGRMPVRSNEGLAPSGLSAAPSTESSTEISEALAKSVSKRSIAVITKKLSSIEATSAKQASTIADLQKRVKQHEAVRAGLEVGLRNEVKENKILKSMMEAAGVSKDVVEEALRQVISGQRVEDVVGLALNL